MKKIILVLVSYITTVSAVTGQTVDLGLKAKNGEIWQTIMRSKEANIGNGVFDPNKIQIGNHLTFKFADGFDTSYTVKAGDNQWNVVKGMLSTMPRLHGPVVEYPTSDSTSEGAVNETPGESVPDSTPWEIPDWLKVVLALLLIGLICWLIWRAVRRTQNQDPALSGPQMRPGGLNRENVYSAMSESAARQFQSSNIRIQRIEEGTLNSHGHPELIDYADNPRRRVLNNEPGFRATVLVGDNPTPRFIYTLLRCGNDVRIGGGLQSEHITFTPLATNAEVPNPTAAPAQTSEAESISASNPMDFKTLVDGLPGIVEKVNETDNGIQLIFKNSNVNFTCTIRPGGDKDDKKEA